jgi:hypothetical protein
MDGVPGSIALVLYWGCGRFVGANSAGRTGETNRVCGITGVPSSVA